MVTLHVPHSGDGQSRTRKRIRRNTEQADTGQCVAVYVERPSPTLQERLYVGCYQKVMVERCNITCEGKLLRYKYTCTLITNTGVIETMHDSVEVPPGVEYMTDMRTVKSLTQTVVDRLVEMYEAVT